MGEAYKRTSEILISSFKLHCSFLSRKEGGPHGLRFLQHPRGFYFMGREAQGKSPAHCCVLSRASRCFPGLRGPRNRPLLRGPGGWAPPSGQPCPPLLQLLPDPALPLAPGACPTQRCFQHFRRGAKPLLHSRKIFVQGLGTRRRGNKSHLGA